MDYNRILDEIGYPPEYNRDKAVEAMKRAVEVSELNNYFPILETNNYIPKTYNSTPQPTPQDLRERAAMLFDELDGMVEKLPKEANWFGNVDHIKQNISLLKKEFQLSAEVSAEKDKRIIALQESEMRLMHSNSRQEQRIAELENQLKAIEDKNYKKINS